MTADAPADPLAPPPPDRGHFRRLDGLRGIAVLMVVAFHCFGLTFQWQLPWQPGGLFSTLHPAGGPLSRALLVLYPFTWGWAGVAVFFVLSGFVIHHAHLRAGGPFRPGTFAARRLLRIYPPYAVALAYFTVDWARHNPGVHGVVVNAAAHAALVHNFAASTYNKVNPSFWSMAVEAQFYALYPLLLWVRRRTNPAGPLVVTAAISVGWWAVQAGRTDWRHAADVPTFPWFNTVFLWSSWTLGMFLADRFAAGRRVFARPAAWGPTLAVAGAAATFFKPTWPVAFPLFAAAGAVAVERALWSPRWGWLGNRWLVGVGLVSYSLYLWHQPLLTPLLKALPVHGRPPAVQFAALLAAGAALAAAVAALSYVAVERPSQLLARRLAPRRPA